MTTLKQVAFTGGILAPSLYGRTDMVKYQTGAKQLRNFIVKRSGGIENRPGTGWVKQVYDSSEAVRLIPFIFNSSQTYVCILNDSKMQFVKSGATVTETAINITAASQASPCVVTSASHGYSNNDEVYITGIVGMTQLNGRNFKVGNVAANTFELTDMDGTVVNSVGYTAYSSGGTVARVYTITTPYAAADVDEIQYTQNADVVTLVEDGYAPRDLSRSADTSWTLSTITYEPNVSRPNGGAATAGAAGSNTYKYRVTSVNAETFEESLPGRAAAKTITHASQAANCLITTSAAHGYIVGDEVYIDSVAGMTDLNGNTYTIDTVPTTTTFTIGTSSTAFGAYTSGGSAYLTYIKLTSAAAPVPGAGHSLTWTAVSGVVEYNVYRELNGVYGFIGVAGSAAFSDIYTTPDILDPPPINRTVFASSSNYPSTVASYQQRTMYGNTVNAPDKVWGTRNGLRKNVTYSVPAQDDDSLAFNLGGGTVNQIKHIVEINGVLVILTSEAEYTIDGNEAGVLTPSNINSRRHSSNGANGLRPVAVNGTILYTQARGSVVRDLFFESGGDGYRGSDLGIFSSHLFDGYTIVDWAYQQVPNSIVWCVRSDGVLLGLTYLREHEIWAWHKHDTDGLVENVCVVPEGTEDAVYLVVKRTIDGDTRRYVERLKSRLVGDIEDSVFVDSSLTYDGWHTGSTTMTLSGGSTWVHTETLTLTASASTFASTDVGKMVFLRSGTTTLRFAIDAYSSATVVTGRVVNMTVPSAMRSTALSTWAIAVYSVTGLWHLEGESVSALGDGLVAASPNNPSATTVTVTNGTATFGTAYAVLHVGLPYVSDLETLDIDTAGGQSLVDQQKMVSEVNLVVESSRGIWAGPEGPTDSDGDAIDALYDTASQSESVLTEFKQRDDSDSFDATALLTGRADIKIKTKWSNGGRLFVRQVDPLPLAILSVAPSLQRIG